MALLVAACMVSAGAASRRALLIGLSCYPRHPQAQLNWNNIHGANDVALLAATLKRQGFAVATLTNRQATAQAVRLALARLAGQTRAGDLVYIHFSGHGQPVEDLDGDEADGWDEALVPYNAGKTYLAGVYEGGNHIIDDELNVCITRVRKQAGVSGFVYVVIDACHAGGMSRGDDDDDDSTFVRGTSEGFSRSGKRYQPRIDARAVIRVPHGPGLAPTCYLESCRAYQTNCEIKEGTLFYGPLSYYVNQVLQACRLTASMVWIEKVRKLMESDKRLIKQNLVVERSVK